MAPNFLRNSKEALSLFWLLAYPAKGRASAVYDLISTRAHLGTDSLYLNLGYWPGARSYDHACELLAKTLAEAAALGPDDALLDVGFGMADQDIYWAQVFSPRKIVGLNITASQVEVACRRVRERNLQERIELREGSATRMPFSAATFDKITALETAFHYQTREDFFREAFRVLKCGGRLALADIVSKTSPPDTSLRRRVAEYFGRSFWQIPKVNMYDSAVYERKLRGVGFVDVAIRSIGDQVIVPFVQFARRRLDEPEVTERIHPLVRLCWKVGVRDNAIWKNLDYIIATADKPRDSR